MFHFFSTSEGSEPRETCHCSTDSHSIFTLLVAELVVECSERCMCVPMFRFVMCVCIYVCDCKKVGILRPSRNTVVVSQAG